MNPIILGHGCGLILGLYFRVQSSNPHCWGCCFLYLNFASYTLFLLLGCSKNVKLPFGLVTLLASEMVNSKGKKIHSEKLQEATTHLELQLGV